MKNIFFFLFLSTSTWAQVGFNNPNPHPKSILDLTAPDKGLLIPRMSQSLREALFPASDPTGEGMLAYQTDNVRGLYYYDGNSWFLLNEWVRNASSNDASLVGTASTLALNTNTVNVPGFPSNALVPAGVIVMWSGSIASIPGGWGLCDGSPGRPDLRDRFIVAAGNSYSPNNSGGANFITLTTNELPNHSHGVIDPGHRHNILGQTGGDNNDNSNTQRFAGGDKGVSESGFFFTNTTANQTSSTGINLTSTGNGQPFDNRPPYFALAFIIKLP
jgi:microcystin-dependent protein